MTFTRAIGLSACAIVLAATTAAASAAIPPPAPASGWSAPHPEPRELRHVGVKTATYLGRNFEVPYSWPIYDLTARPTTCVRFDVHAVYLGRPSGEQQCPARGAGRRTGALLIEPDLTRSTDSGVGAVTIALDHPISAEIDVGSWRHRVRWSPPSARSSLPPELRYADSGFRELREGA